MGGGGGVAVTVLVGGYRGLTPVVGGGGPGMMANISARFW